MVDRDGGRSRAFCGPLGINPDAIRRRLGIQGAFGARVDGEDRLAVRNLLFVLFYGDELAAVRNFFYLCLGEEYGRESVNQNRAQNDE